MWNDLMRWVEESDGSSVIHKSLTLRSISGTTTTADDHQRNHQRGLFAADVINCGEILIRLPLATSINGEMMPCTYEIAKIDNEKEENATTTKSTRTVSPWLRCLAALLKETKLHDDRRQPYSSPYLESLPYGYETLWEWSNREMEEYLAGTRPPDYSDLTSTTYCQPEIPKNRSECSSPFPSRSNPWLIMNDPKQTRQKYETMIRPYLIHCGIFDGKNCTALRSDNENTDEEQYQCFQRACQIMSTRSFYNMNARTSIRNHYDEDAASNVINTQYDGPYLLPVIDLINHADTCTGSTNTKLEFILQQHLTVPSCTFEMRAIRTIQPNTEILHSYGDELSNYQFLSSFGCIPINRMISAQLQPDRQQVDAKSSESTTTDCSTSVDLSVTVPVVTNVLYTKSVTVTKQEIWSICWDIIESGWPQQLAASMIESQSFDPDEVWSISVDKCRATDCVPNNIVIGPPTSMSGEQSYDNPPGVDGNNAVDHDSSCIISDELVTTACIPFLPKCAYAEITSRTLLDVSILQDYYLGQLVGTALLKTIQQRLLLYRPIPTSTIQRLLPSVPLRVATMDDKEILCNLLHSIETTDKSVDAGENKTIESALYIERCRLAYGLTIRLEEKEVLTALGNAILKMLNSLNLCVDNDSNTYDTLFGNETSNKKLKPNED